MLTPTSKVLRSDSRGFTLIELLVVMAIIGISLTVLMPKLASTASKGLTTQDFFASVIKDTIEQSAELNRQVCLRGEKSSANIYTEDNKKITITGGPVMSADINGIPSDGAQYVICFYPDGLFDQFDLRTSSGKTISADPITKMVTVK